MWDGVCYDGPNEGQRIKHYNGYYRVALCQPLSACQFNPDVSAAPTLTLHYGTYIWSRCLRKWVFDPRGVRH